VGPVLVREGDC